MTPVIRVRQMQENLAALDCFEAETRVAIIDRLGEAAKVIESSPSSSWFPIELDVEFAEIVGDQTGVEGTRRWARRGLERSLGAPFLKSIVRGAVGMFGLEPARVLRLVPRGTSNIYRNCGTWQMLPLEDGFVDLVWDGVPTRFSDSVMCRESFAGALEAILSVLGRTGTVTYTERGRSLVFHMRWDSDS